MIEKINSKIKKVIWFILDEYDPGYIENKSHKIKLNHITNLIDNSFYHKNVFSPSSFNIALKCHLL